ncbi:MAG: hypothetical protein ACRDAQ_08295 [Cetobacterium sp.]
MKYIFKNTYKTNFTTVGNDFLNDKNLSLCARLLGVLILSKPTNWVINPYSLKKELGIGTDKTKALINELIAAGYMAKLKKPIVFAKQGEMKNDFFFSDNLAVLKSYLEDLMVTPILDLPNSAPRNIPPRDFPTVENTVDTNKVGTNKVITNENTINNKDNSLTIDACSSLEAVMDKVLDSGTKTNLLKSKPNMTLEEFRELYNKVEVEFQNGFCKSINSCLILAARGAWNFRSLQQPNNCSTKDRKIIESKADYYFDYFKIAHLKPEEVLEKFSLECQKYDSSLVKFYYDSLKERLV